MDEFIRTLQLAITPVTLISGVGLLVLSMTNRFAHMADRARSLAQQARQTPEAGLAQQMRILYRRSQILLVAISLALASVFFVGLLIIGLFASPIMGLDIHIAGGILFALSLGSLILALALFILDMTLSLHALQVELKDYL